MIIGIDASASGIKSTGTGRYINCLLEQLKKFDEEIKVFPVNGSKEVNNSSLSRKDNRLKRYYYRSFGLTREMEKLKVEYGIFPNYFISGRFSKSSAIVIHDLSFITHPQFYSKQFVFYYKYMLKKTLRHDPLILAVSEHTKENINKYLNIKKENILLLQAYSNIKIISNYSKEPHLADTPYFLYVGHIEPRKNLLFLIENFIKWKNENKVNIQLKIIGEVWIKSADISYLLGKYRDHPDIIFKGYISEDELDYSYKNASGFVHTSLEEGFGFPVLEAMHYGLPVLCSENHAAKEISSPYSITINPYKDESLVRGLSELFDKKSCNIIPRADIKYSPELMNSQLSLVLDILHSRVYSQFCFRFDKSENYEEAIEKTLLYSHLFNGGLHKKDLFTYLFDIKINEEQFEKALSGLILSNRIYLNNDNVSLNYRNINIYKKENKELGKRKITKSLKIIKIIPFISCICFSGGTANYGIENHNDIDLFIITKPHSLYLVYLIIHILSKIFKLRKQLCANFLIDETAMEIKEQHDYYTAHQIVFLVPFKNSGLLNLFRKYNSWTKDFFPNYEQIFSNQIPPEKKPYNFYLLLKPVNILFKNFYRLLYRNYLKKDFKGAVKLDDNCIKLYTNDHRIKIMEAFNKEWKEYLKVKRSIIYEPVNSDATGTYA